AAPRLGAPCKNAPRGGEQADASVRGVGGFAPAAWTTIRSRLPCPWTGGKRKLPGLVFVVGHGGTLPLVVAAAFILGALGIRSDPVKGLDHKRGFFLRRLFRHKLNSPCMHRPVAHATGNVC